MKKLSDDLGIELRIGGFVHIAQDICIGRFNTDLQLPAPGATKQFKIHIAQRIGTNKTHPAYTQTLITQSPGNGIKISFPQPEIIVQEPHVAYSPIGHFFQIRHQLV